MIKTLKEYLERNFFSSEKQADSKHTLEISAAVLMLEIAFADSSLDEVEEKMIRVAMQSQFHLPSDEAETLIGLAKQESDHAVSLYDFTRIINDNLDREKKVEIIELLWRVANADMIIDKYEEYFIRKISDLLYVSHSDYILAKHKVSETI